MIDLVKRENMQKKEVTMMKEKSREKRGLKNSNPKTKERVVKKSGESRKSMPPKNIIEELPKR